MKHTRLDGVAVGWHSLPTAVSTIVWSFIHVLDAPQMVPNKEQRRASRAGAQRHLTTLEIDERWENELSNLNHLEQHRMAAMVLSRFSISKVSHFKLTLDHGTVLPTFLMPICTAFSGASSVHVWFTDAQYLHAARLLLGGRNLTSLAFLPMCERRATKELAAIMSNKLTKLTLNQPELSIAKWVDHGVLSRIEIMDMIASEPASIDLFVLMPRLHTLITRFEDLDNDDDLTALAKALIVSAPQLQRLKIEFDDSHSYTAPASALSALLELNHLIALEFELDKGVVWSGKSDSSYDIFARSALVCWPDMEELLVCLPVTDQFWRRPGMGGSKLRRISFDTKCTEEARGWMLKLNPTCQVVFKP